MLRSNFIASGRLDSQHDKPHDAQVFGVFRRFRIRYRFFEGHDPWTNDAELQTPPSLTITAMEGLALLAKCGELPDVEEEAIENKSKANDLAKATVITQATWMLIQALVSLGISASGYSTRSEHVGTCRSAPMSWRYSISGDPCEGCVFFIYLF